MNVRMAAVLLHLLDVLDLAVEVDGSRMLITVDCVVLVGQAQLLQDGRVALVEVVLAYVYLPRLALGSEDVVIGRVTAEAVLINQFFEALGDAYVFALVVLGPVPGNVNGPVPDVLHL